MVLGLHSIDLFKVIAIAIIIVIIVVIVICITDIITVVIMFDLLLSLFMRLRLCRRPQDGNWVLGVLDEQVD